MEPSGDTARALQLPLGCRITAGLQVGPLLLLMLSSALSVTLACRYGGLKMFSKETCRLDRSSDWHVHQAHVPPDYAAAGVACSLQYVIGGADCPVTFPRTSLAT